MSTASWRKFHGNMSSVSREGGAANAVFESLPLTPPRPSTPSRPKKSNEMSPPGRSRIENNFSFSPNRNPTTPSPLGGLQPPPLGLPPVAPVLRDSFSRSSSFNYSAENQSRIVQSSRGNDRSPPHHQASNLSRVPSMTRSLTRNSSTKESNRTLNRLLSMEKGENWRWSPYEEGNRTELDSEGQESELDSEVLEGKSPLLDGSFGLVKIIKHGSLASKKLLAIIVLTFAYSATEFLVGIVTGRIGLVSDSFHLTFGCGVLTFSLYAMVLSKSRPNEMYSYGYGRLEVLAAFTNSLFLLFLSFSLAVEALHAFVQDESEHKHYLIVSAVANLTVNLIGVWFFRSYARVRVVYRKAEDMNNHSICLHVLSDSIRSAGVVLASWLLALGVKYAETLCLGLVAVAMFLTAMPLFKASGGVLLQMAPPGISLSAFSKCQRQVTLLEEVLDCYNARFWDIVPGSVVGTLVIQIKAGADEQKILKHVHSIYNDIGVKDLTVQLSLDGR